MADQAQQEAVARMLERRHNVMVNCGPGTGKTYVMKLVHDGCPGIGAAFLATGSTDRVVGNLVARGMPGANLQRLESELDRLNNAKPMSPVARANEGLVEFLLALKKGSLVVLAIDECGLVSAELFDRIIKKLFELNPMCFRERRVLLYMTADFANQLPPIKSTPFIFSTAFYLIRPNTFFPLFRKQHRFGGGAVAREVAGLLAADHTELEAYLKAQQRGYKALSPARLARLATFLVSRSDCEEHIANALRVAYDGEHIPSFTVAPAKGHEDSTKSETTRATYWMVPDMTTMVEVTTFGGALKGENEDGEEVSLPNRSVCELLELYDVPEEAGADSLAGKASASLMFEGEVVTVPLIHKLDGVNCVTLRMCGCRDDGDIICEAHVAYNEQGYEYPGTLAVGTLESTEQREIEREMLLVIATRTPLGPEEVLFHPGIRLKRSDPKKHAAYRNKLVHFTPDPSGSGTTRAKETAAPKRAAAEAAAPPPALLARPRLQEHPGAFLGSLY